MVFESLFKSELQKTVEAFGPTARVAKRLEDIPKLLTGDTTIALLEDKLNPKLDFENLARHILELPNQRIVLLYPEKERKKVINKIPRKLRPVIKQIFDDAESSSKVFPDHELIGIDIRTKNERLKAGIGLVHNDAENKTGDDLTDTERGSVRLIKTYIGEPTIYTDKKDSPTKKLQPPTGTLTAHKLWQWHKIPDENDPNINPNDDYLRLVALFRLAPKGAHKRDTY